MIRAGRLSHLVNVQQLTDNSPQQTASGEPDQSWANYQASVAASIEPVIGREFFAGNQVQSEVDTKIRMRYLPGVNDSIDSKMRVVHPTTCPCAPPAQQIFEIKGAANVDMKNREWLLYAATGVTQG